MGDILSRLRAKVGLGPMPSPSAPLPVAGAMRTDVGAVRDNNEDSVAYVLPAGGEPGLAIVADGMGGHAAGEVASAITAATLKQTFYDTTGRIPDRLAAGIVAANAAVRAHMIAYPETSGMGSTCSALAFFDNRAWLGHVGDSRCYLIRGETIRQVSEDHSMVAEMVRQGRLTEAEADASPDKNVILKAIGVDDRVVPQIDRDGLPMEDGDCFLLCSDGLSDLLAPLDMAGLIRAAATPDDACRALIEAAIAAGGHDNVSAGVFRAGAFAVPAAASAPGHRTGLCATAEMTP